ncbi:deoxyribodipyrimidine photolyase-related protein [Gloeomargarita lithophora Alchichica-D10]|uniref:Deoxyribodipyrimidine photolyase-related protein n=1 Tax=Gloeomargarita lithophora Alchichica-D10 TaxID=1188229 RepID=A0A1J0AAC1_9CYAN|nr:cryptochrome/photolyase family protein [Gloeomargarita lithophora]APB32849.1 deoxyribodipyrimidine photolyase-related protein [Gloeomargarita lithophora Alchichica-D10]
MRDATVIFPDQLFQNHPGLQLGRLVFLVEEQLFFRDYYYPAQFHQKKLVLHRASMQAYAHELKNRGYDLVYISYQLDPRMDYLFQTLQSQQIQVIYICELVDNILTKRLNKWCAYYQIKIIELTTPKFLTPWPWFQEQFKPEPPHSLTKFYIAQRKRLNILVDGDKPLGGKWSFDPENRKKLPKHITIPEISWPSPNVYVLEAQAYVAHNFPHHWGSVASFHYPITHTEAEIWLQNFLVQRFTNFGDYEDAISVQYDILFHSVLTPMLNIGLLTPEQVINQVVNYAKSYPVGLNTLEGFVRQIIGWREFMAGMYLRIGTAQRQSNFWNHTRPMPDSFYTGNTGILPLDHVIKKVLKTAYCHHIERLMILGNFMLLCEIHPQGIYQWFMEFFIDSYDWVMVPNIYGMSQYSDGGWMTTKPYISGSNYIRKMSDFPVGDWSEIWDGLYWRFIDKHQDFFSQNPRLNMMTILLKKMNPVQRQTHWQKAEHFLAGLA